MLKYIYGEFTDEQFQGEIKSLHSALFWLLLYKDPKTSNEYPNVDVNKYLKSLMLRINGLSSLFNNSPVVVHLQELLEEARLENQKAEFDYGVYRKLVLDAHSLVDKLPGNTEGR
jgi:hypothetical protein